MVLATVLPVMVNKVWRATALIGDFDGARSYQNWQKHMVSGNFLRGKKYFVRFKRRKRRKWSLIVKLRCEIRTYGRLDY